MIAIGNIGINIAACCQRDGGRFCCRSCSGRKKRLFSMAFRINVSHSQLILNSRRIFILTKLKVSLYEAQFLMKVTLLQTLLWQSVLVSG